MTEHSLIGASSLSRLMACPGSFNLSKQVGVPGRASRYAAEGTAAHRLAETWLTTYQPVDHMLGETLTIDGYEITVDQAMLDAVSVYVTEVKQRRNRGLGWVRWAIEQRVCLDDYWIDAERPPVSAFGTADAAIYHYADHHLDIIDLKYGAHTFVPADSPQLLFYAAGGLLDCVKAGNPVKTIDLTVVQPRGKLGDPVRTFSTTALDVEMWVGDVLKPTIAAATAQAPMLVMGEHCRWCPARAQCPAYAATRREAAQRAARHEFGLSPDALVLMSNEELGEALTECARLETYIEALKERAIAVIEDGDTVPGWDVRPTRPTRSWALPPERLEVFLPDSVRPSLYTHKLRTPADAEKTLHPEDWEVLKDFVQTKSSGVKLVPKAAGSARPSAAEDFA